MDFRIEVITLPVSDVDGALQFYTQRAGFILDVDYRPNKQLRVVQLTPPGSSCSVQFGAASLTRDQDPLAPVISS
jgi:hypothetical protein